MVVPAFPGHDARHQNQGDQGDGTCQQRCTAEVFLCPVIQSHHAESDPDGKGIERTRVSVVAFPWLVWVLVEVQDDGNTRHEEEQCHNKHIFLVGIQVVEQAGKSQQQGQEIESIACGVMHALGQVVLHTQACIVDK